jgi:glycogen debranching enzyme
MIEDFWDEESGLFRTVGENGPVPVVTPFNLYPLWTGQLPDNIRDRLVGHLTNEEMFWGDIAIPSVARNDPHFEADTMWRGPVWANVNYFFVEALRQIGRDDLADKLVQDTLELIMRQHGMYEYYNAVSGEPPSKAAIAFGWTASVFIDLAVQASQKYAENEAGE